MSPMTMRRKSKYAVQIRSRRLLNGPRWRTDTIKLQMGEDDTFRSKLLEVTGAPDRGWGPRLEKMRFRLGRPLMGRRGGLQFPLHVAHAHFSKSEFNGYHWLRSFTSLSAIIFARSLSLLISVSHNIVSLSFVLNHIFKILPTITKKNYKIDHIKVLY